MFEFRVSCIFFHVQNYIGHHEQKKNEENVTRARKKQKTKKRNTKITSQKIATDFTILIQNSK